VVVSRWKATFVLEYVVAEVYVEYHGERTMSTTTLVVSSDFEDEIQEPGDDDQPDIVITAKSAES
jgi:hypothetical protein